MTYGPPSGVPGRVFVDSNSMNSKTCRKLICLAFLQSLERRHDDGNLFLRRVVEQGTESNRQGFGQQESSKVAFLEVLFFLESQPSTPESFEDILSGQGFPDLEGNLGVSKSIAPKLCRQGKK